MNIPGDGLNYLSSILKLNQLYKPEDMYTKDPLIKDKNELINNIKYIYRDISRFSETMEYNYSNNFQLLNNINDKDNFINNWTKSEILYKFGINSPLYKQSTLLYNKLLSNITNNGKEIKSNDNEEIEMKIESEDNLKAEEIKEKKTSVNSLCDELDNDENRMDIVDENENKEKCKNESKKKILIDGHEVILENEGDCLKKIAKYEELF